MTTSTTGERTPLFLLGVGFIGGSLLKSLLATNKYSITALTRSDDKAKVLESMGVKPLLGSLSDEEIIEKATLENDVIIHTATADDLPSVKAILKGLEARPNSSPAAVYIHTSGTGELIDDGAGTSASNHIFSDTRPQDIYDLPLSAPHREIDLTIEKAVRDGKVGKAKVAVLMPPLIYGIGNGPFNKTTIQIPTWIAEAVHEKQVSVVGKGAGVWNHINVHNLVTAYEAILDHLLSTTPSRDVYWFAETGEHTWLSIAEAMDSALRAKGLVDEPLRFSPTPHYMGSNSRSSADRLRALGWKGDKVDISVWDSLKEELEVILKDEEFLKKGAEGSPTWSEKEGKYINVTISGRKVSE